MNPFHLDSVLLVIDMQYDFMPGGALAVAEGDTLVPLINRLGQQFRGVVITQDWHPAGHISFASSHSGRVPFEVTTLPYGPQTLWPDHCIQGSHGVTRFQTPCAGMWSSSGFSRSSRRMK